MDAIARLAESNTVVLVLPSGSIDATGLFAASKTLVETNPRAFVELTGLLAASYPMLVRFPSGSTLAITPRCPVKYSR